MTSKVLHKVIHKLKRPEEEWYFNATSKMLHRFHYLLGLASAYDYSQCKYFDPLWSGEYQERPGQDYKRTDRETTWQKFQNEIELKFGRIDNDSCSTLATMDDNPGTGRLIDKFVYQSIGRSIERLFLNLELRNFHPPEKSASRIKRFLEGSVYFGNLIPVDKIFEHRFQYYNTFDDDVDFNEVCVSLFKEISRNEKISKAFHRLLMQASSKNRSLRVEAQKQIWSLFRYENMVFILNAVTDLEGLIWDGYTSTFQHCSPLDPDFQIHFNFIWEMNCLDGDGLIDMLLPLRMGLLSISVRDILETCARENRGFSSLPINLVMKLLEGELYTYIDHEEQKLEDTEKFAENLYLALTAITGFCNEFPYASDLLSEQMLGQFLDYPRILLPLWEEDRTESDINALEMMVHFMLNLIISIRDVDSRSFGEKELRYYMALLNDADKDQGRISYLEARASEDYLQKVTDVHVQRGPISFAKFKAIVTNPLIWERYHRPGHQTDVSDKSRVSATWKYELYIDSDEFLDSPILSFHYIPFSDNFRSKDFTDLLSDITFGLERFSGAVGSWFRIQKWLEELNENSVVFACDRPGSALYRVMRWWWTYDIQREMSRIEQELRWPKNSTYPPLRHDWGTTCQCRICTRYSRVQNRGKYKVPLWRTVEEYCLLRFWTEYRRVWHSTAKEFSPLPSRSGFLKRKLEELESRPQIVPLPRRYRDNTAEDAEPGSSLGPVRKKQRTSFSLESDTSDADAIITEVDEDSTEWDTGSEDAMSLNEDFWSAKSKLSLLAIED